MIRVELTGCHIQWSSLNVNSVIATHNKGIALRRGGQSNKAESIILLLTSQCILQNNAIVQTPIDCKSHFPWEKACMCHREQNPKELMMTSTLGLKTCRYLKRD